MSTNELIARASFLWSLLGLAVLALPPMLLVNWLVLGHPLSLPLLLVAGLGGVSLTALGCLWCVYRVSPDGITGYTMLVVERSLSWAEVDHASVRWILVFRYLEVTSSSGSTILIPTYLRGREEFFRATLRFAPEGPTASPVRQLLGEEGRDR